MKEIFNFFEVLVLVKVFAYHGIFGNRKGSAGEALKVKVQLTYCVNNNVILYVFLFFWGLLWPWKLTSSEHWMNVFIVFVSLMSPFLPQLIMRKRKINYWSIFEWFTLRWGEIFGNSWTLLTLNNLITQKNNSIQTLKTFQKSNYLHCSILHKIHNDYSNSPCLEHFDILS